jgi:hypothetical protein
LFDDGPRLLREAKELAMTNMGLSAMIMYWHCFQTHGAIGAPGFFAKGEIIQNLKPLYLIHQIKQGFAAQIALKVLAEKPGYQ